MNSFQLIDRHWWHTLETVATRCREQLRIICPFITHRALQHLVGRAAGGCRVITRFALADWATGVSDPLALKWLIERGGEVRGLRDLHTKLYVFDGEAAILGSANLSWSALNTNHELGAVITDPNTVRQCTEYFDALWDRLEPKLTIERLNEWLDQLAAWTQTHRPTPGSELPDYGTKVPQTEPPTRWDNRPHRRRRSSKGPDGEQQAWVKFQGSGTRRITRNTPILEEIERSGCHWACSYPRRPRSVRTGDTIFLARMMQEPNDTLIFGRAVTVEHVEGRDDATAADIELRPFRGDYPHYVRVLNPQFLAGTFHHGISLFQLIDDLGPDTLVTTQRHQRERSGDNTDPRQSLKQKPAARLTAMASELLEERLDAAFARYGTFDLNQVPALDWPPEGEPLSAAGRRLLAVLVRQLTAERIDPEQPETFPSYRDISMALGLPPNAGPGLGPQLRRAGLDDLDEWTRRYGLPAITGFIVRRQQRTPGEEFFTLHNHRANDVDWWGGELCAAAAFPWRRLL